MCRENYRKSALKRQILPTNVKPTHYKLSLLPSLETVKFSGQVSISLTVMQETKLIQLNAKEIKVTSASVVGFRLPNLDQIWPDESVLNLPKQHCYSITHQDDEETVTLLFDLEIPASSKIILHLEFEGIHNDKMNGFYRSTYIDADGKRKHLLCTQFEPSDARKAFPCWDEPNLKATFDVTLHVPVGLVGLSNMSVVEENEIEIGAKKYTALKFATTPIMSTYLLAFCVGDFEYVEAMANPSSPSDAKPIQCRTYTLRGQKHLGLFALETSVRVLEFFSHYFDIAYPLPKLDQIAIPDFSAGAMENWGLITYRESYLLYEPGTFSAKALEDVADTVAHELAHQWFGNLVTMDWWDELWLNEGFATFVGSLAVDHLFPKWDHFTGFLDSYLSAGLSHDALLSSHPVHVQVSSPAEVEQIFDLISYCKGASVIRMLESFLGRSVFSKGVNQYLKEHAYQNATTQDLWSALSTASNLDVKLIMNNWIEETGYPVIQITQQKYDAEKKQMTLSLKQDRFLSFKSESTEDHDINSINWFIPITVKTDSFPISVQYLDTKEGSITFPYASSHSSFFKLNGDYMGFYRIGYSSDQLSSIQSCLQQDLNLFSVQDRIQLVSDAFSCAKAGVTKTSTALNLLVSLKNETSGTVLSMVSRWLSSVQEAFKSDSLIYLAIKKLMRDVFGPKVKQMGFEFPNGEDYLQIKKRTIIISSAAEADSEEALEEILARFRLYCAGERTAIDPNLYETVFTTVLRTTKEPKRDFHLIFEVYHKSTNLTEKLAALRSLGAVNDSDLLYKLLHEYVLDTSIVKAQDTQDALYGLSHSPINNVLEIKWQWWVENFTKLSELMDVKNLPISAVLSSFVGLEFAGRVEKWMRGEELRLESERKERVKKLQSVTRDFETGVESIRVRSAWFSRDQQDLLDWVSP